MRTLADDVACDAFSGWDPARPPLTHREFAKLTLLPGGPLKGTNYDPATDPVQSYFTDQLDSGRWRALFWAAPPQIAGKTQCAIIVPTLRAILELKASVGYGLPTLHDLDRGWQTKIAPTFREAGYGAYLPQRGPGSKGGRPPSVTFEDPNASRAPLGSVIFLAGAAKQVTCRVIALDELDAWRNADGEPRWGDIEDVWARADAFQSEAIRIGVGTVETDDPKRSIILACVNELGTGTRLWAKCRHCAAYHKLEWSGFQYEYRTLDGQPGPDLRHAASTAAYVCPGCAVRWSEDDRRRAILSCAFAHKGQTVDAAGIVCGDPPKTDAFGLRTTALDCILTTLGAIAERHAAARYALDQHGNHDPMRKFYRYQRVEHYTGDQQTDEDSKETPHTHQTLAQRSERTAWAEIVENGDEDKLWSRYSAAHLPAAVSTLSAAIDVQRNRVYWTLVGIDDERRTYDVAWGIERARSGADGKEPPPFSPGDLSTVLTRAADWIEHLGGPDFTLGVVDVSDGVTQGECAEWLSTRAKWHAIQGESHLPEVRATNGIQTRTGLCAWDTSWRNGLGSYRVVTDLAQQAIAEAYKIDPTSPGAAMLPGPLRRGNAYLRHLTAVGWVTTAAGKRTWKALPGAGRFDYFDCRAYATAAGFAYLAAPAARVEQAIDLPIMHLGGLRL
jgi:hypothetical protein